MKPGKSKLALAKVINENGGWPQDSEWAVQNGDHGRISFSINKPVRHDSKSWMAKGGFNFKIEVCKPLKNWHQCVLNREEYYQAYPMTDDDGWVEWKGGECPVYGDDDVDVVLVDGSTDHGIADEFDWHRDSGPLSVASYRLRNADVGGWLNWNGGECPVGDGVLIDVKKVDGSAELAVHDPQDRIWGDTDHRKCIIAYRLHKPEAKPEFCESVMRSIPEPESKPTIEQLAQDYRNKLDLSNRKQQEADDAKVAADAALGELERAGEAPGLLIGIAKQDQEPELVITEWRDLMVGDEISVFDFEDPSYNSDKKMALSDGLCVVTSIDGGVYIAPIAIADVHLKYWNATGADACEFKFIRRP